MPSVQTLETQQCKKVLKVGIELFCFVFKVTQVFNDARATLWFSSGSSITTMQCKPVMHSYFKRCWHHFKWFFAQPSQNFYLWLI